MKLRENKKETNLSLPTTTTNTVPRMAKTRDHLPTLTSTQTSQLRWRLPRSISFRLRARSMTAAWFHRVSKWSTFAASRVSSVPFVSSIRAPCS